MRFRELYNEASSQQLQVPSGSPAGGNLEGVRQAGESLFRAADEAIHRALSGNSLAFLHATRQEGGE